MSTMVMNPTVVALPRLRLTPRGRAVFGTLAAIPLVLLALALGVGAPSADAGAAASLDTFSYVSVAPGQSLWQVAETLAPEADPREVIADIMALNQLASSAVEPGQKLAIPTAYAP
ncbi:MAG: hypothetical protein CMF56_05815 [Leifsonia sp.]|nr:hypothetical protein [Leifsonia sp.]|tara:strand:+ start:47679 stop:48026 length:348 start_codon:yes stop_codon:yes gene_type:complete